jgi:hypothetical protein
VLDERTHCGLGVVIALAEHGHRQPHIGHHPAGAEPVDRNMHRARDVSIVELRTVANVHYHIVTKDRG